MGLPWIEIVECLDPDPQLVLWRYPDPDGRIKSGAQLIVRENQAALLLSRGQASGVYAPGTHTLPTQNIPILSNLQGWKYGFASPHVYDIFYVATRQFVDLKWGTPAPVMMLDPRFGQVRVRAFGSYSVRITDIPRFFREYAGAYPVLSIRDLEAQLRDSIAANFAEVLATQQISVVDVAANLTAVNLRLAPAIAPLFQNLGVEVTQFTITSVTLPDEVNQYYDKVTGMNMVGDMSRFQAFNTALATADTSTAVGRGVQDGMAMGMVMGQVQQPVAQPAAPAPAVEDVATRLGKLKQLADAGLISEEEFAAKKAQILEEL